jgi:hypothetical protein
MKMMDGIGDEVDRKIESALSNATDKLYLMDVKDFDVKKFMEDFRKELS